MYLNPKDLSKYWALDIETDDLDATRIWICCVQNLETGETAEFTEAKDFRRWMKPHYAFVTHNGISFDVPVLNRLWLAGIRMRSVVDTLVLSLLYNPKLPKPSNYTGLKGAHSLECWGFRLGCGKIDFDDWTALTDEMRVYCRQDVNLTCKLYLALMKRMNDLKFSEESAAIEHQFRYLINIQERTGFKFNRTRANMFYQYLRGEEYKLAKQIRAFFGLKRVLAGEYTYRVKKDGNPVASFLRHESQYPEIKFNKSKTKYRVYKDVPFEIGSPIQRRDRLLELGWKPTSFTPKGNPKIDEESIVAFANKSGIPAVQMIADWLVLNGRANMVRTWLNNLQKDDCIHGTVFSCGAGTRRCTHSSPNTANIPSITAKYGASARALWTARPKRVLVGCDASGLEGRVFIHYLGSKEAEAFMLDDPHTANAEAISEAVGFRVSRAETKNLFYARLYGASDRKLGSMVGKGPKVGTLIRSAIDSNIPGFSELVEAVEREFNNNGGRILTIDGGFVTCPSVHAALNYKFQSAGAIFMKKAKIIFHAKSQHLDFLYVGDIHDEWQLDCKPEHADEVGRLACEAMTEAGEALGFNIKMEGEFSVGRNWAETH